MQQDRFFEMDVEGNYDGAVNPVITQGKSTISKLSIRGIRSFDPGHEEGERYMWYLLATRRSRRLCWH